MKGEETLRSRANALFPGCNFVKVRRPVETDGGYLNFVDENEDVMSVPLISAPPRLGNDEYTYKNIPRNDPRRKELHVLAKLLGAL